MKTTAFFIFSALCTCMQTAHAQEVKAGPMQIPIIADFRSLVPKCVDPAGEFVRIAFHEPGTFRLSDRKGGNDGSLRLTAEINAPQNRGLASAIAILSTMAKKHKISFADAVVVSSIVSAEVCGAPKMPISFGRKDTNTPNDPNRLPSATVTARQIRDQFVTGMGFTLEQTVALIGGSHSMGHVNVNNSGLPTGDMDTTKEKMDVTYFRELLLAKPPTGITRVPADQNMANDAEMKRIMQGFIANPTRFLQVFATAYVKLLNLGARFF